MSGGGLVASRLRAWSVLLVWWGRAALIHTAGDLASFLHGRRLWSIEQAHCLRGHGSKKEARVAAACITQGYHTQSDRNQRSTPAIVGRERWRIVRMSLAVRSRYLRPYSPCAY